jgi:predicted nucleotidyltransferase
MGPPPAERLAAALAAEPDVRVAYLFGSRAEGRAAEGSDWDVAVLLERGAPFERAVALGDTLRATLGEPLDLLSLERAPIELAIRVVLTGRLLHARSEAERVDYEATMMARGHDLAPLLERQRREILEGSPHDRALERYRAALAKARRLHDET